MEETKEQKLLRLNRILAERGLKGIVKFTRVGDCNE